MRAEIEKAVTLLQSGKPAAMDQALALLQGTVFNFSMKVCGSREDAEDTMQEVLLRSIRYLPRFDSPRALAVWLYKVARSRCLMSRRRSKFAPQENLSLENLMPDRRELFSLSLAGRSRSGETPESALLRGEDARRLQEAVRRLPPDYRVILILHDMEQLSGEEIAKITALKPGTVRVRLHRARLFVRRELAGKNGRRAPKLGRASAPAAKSALPRPGRCKAMFAEISNYLDDALDDALCVQLEKHMDGCEPCKAFLSSLEKTVQQCRKTPDAQPNPHRAAQLREKLLTEYRAALAGRAEI
jgi:RNA polymerase sigma-70 factor (ECF subfamily)